MAEQSNYVDLRINVNGKIHNVKVQKGITFGKPYDNYGYNIYNSPSVWTCEEDGVYSATTKPKNDIYYSEIASLTGVKKEIKMSEAEFALFRNVANNVNEGGILTLSDKDITEAQNKYERGEFTKDISKDLPKGCKAESKSSQILYIDGVGGCLNTASMSFLNSNAGSFIKAVKPSADKSQSGNVEVEYSEGSICGMSYKGKDNKTYHVGTDGIISQIEYDNADGKHVVETYTDRGDTLYFIKKEWTENGKSITEITDYSYPDNSHREEKYVDDKGRNVLDIYKDNVLKSRSLEYTLNGKHFEEKYENGKLTSKIAHYSTKGSDYDNGYDEYDDKGRLSKQSVDNHTWKYEYNDKGERELLYEVVPLIYKESGKPAGTRIKKYGAQIDLNYRINNVKTFAGLDIEKNKKVESSEKVEKYKKEFHHKGEETIAATIKDQIDGFSRNDKTLAMVDAIPEDKAITVLKYYKELSSFWGKEKPLFVALDEEMGIGKEEIMPIMRRFCAIYLGQKNNADEITKEDVELAKKIQAGCQDGEDFTQYMKDIDALLTR